MRKVLFISVLFLGISTLLFAQEKVNNCYDCHKENEILPEDFNENDVHFKVGLTCADCHGGKVDSEDEDIAMSEAFGFKGAPDFTDVPQFCGKCHSNIEYMRKYHPRMETDQVKQYFTSVHGKQLKKGNTDVANCVSCHTAHSILSPKDPRSTVYALNVPSTCRKCHADNDLMKKYNIRTDVFDEYSESVHGIALLKNKDTGAPACNDCHGNHGAVPPGVNSISYVCGECHYNNMQLFKASKMGLAFMKKDLHGCVECHGNHRVEKSSDEFVGTSQKAFCIKCHKEGDKGYLTANLIHSEIASLAEMYDSANYQLDEVKRKGMDDVDIEFILKDVKQNLIQSRTAVHSFDTNMVKEKTTEGKKLVNEALKKAKEEIDEYYTRRNGFLAATFVFTLLIIGLYLKIKDMSKKNS